MSVGSGPANIERRFGPWPKVTSAIEATNIILNGGNVVVPDNATAIEVLVNLGVSRPNAIARVNFATGGVEQGATPETLGLPEPTEIEDFKPAPVVQGTIESSYPPLPSRPADRLLDAEQYALLFDEWVNDDTGFLPWVDLAHETYIMDRDLPPYDQDSGFANVYEEAMAYAEEQETRFSEIIGIEPYTMNSADLRDAYLRHLAKTGDLVT